ncbi:MAG: L-threonylcarbamoyladenylate synthase [Prevotella sp.]|nr:L-threonylcarbamoyladenylate synthase [Prevotella sp.]MCM1074655.1 L-threonylcarbamoyladenylate synthase [Ruminococcus sp.]
MERYKIWNNEISRKQALQFAERLEAGELMVYPTDTLYAIGCDALNVKAIEKLCRLQGLNPEKVCLSIICEDISQSAEYARIDNKCFRLMKDNVPGPFTFIFKAAGTLPKAFKGRKEVGIRIPDCRAPLQIVEALGHPILTATIHAADEDYTVNPELIADVYEGKADFMLIGEEGGTEPSTILDCIGPEPEIIRQGKGVLS